jgi:hypothetical protein
MSNVEVNFLRHWTFLVGHSTFCIGPLKKRFPRWDDLLAAPRRTVEKLIWSDGLSKKKTLALRAALRKLHTTFGRCTLKPAGKWSDDKLEEFLCTLPGFLSFALRSSYFLVTPVPGRPRPQEAASRPRRPDPAQPALQLARQPGPARPHHLPQRTAAVRSVRAEELLSALPQAGDGAPDEHAVADGHRSFRRRGRHVRGFRAGRLLTNDAAWCSIQNRMFTSELFVLL